MNSVVNRKYVSHYQRVSQKTKKPKARFDNLLYQIGSVVLISLYLFL
jgi:ribosomal protein S17